MIATIEAEAERLSAVLDGEAGALEPLPARLRDLVVLATEIADTLARPALDGATRRRILRRAFRMAERRRRIQLPAPLPAVRLRTAIVAGGATLGLTALGVALRWRAELAASRA